MARTRLKSLQINDNTITSGQIIDGAVTRSDLNTSTSGSAVIRKLVQGTGLSISSTGADSGTGDVTVNLGIASASALGGVKIGSGISISADGTISASASGGTVTSVSGTGTVSGITLSGTVTSSGSLTLGGTLSLTSAQVTTALGFTPYNATNPSGYITGITSSMVTTALGYTPYNSTNPSGYQASSGVVARIGSRDNRTISPSSDNAYELRFGFTSFGNNNTSPWADYLHLRSYSDNSGGNDNLVVFRKDTIGMRIYQQTFGSSTAYTTFKDVAFTDSSITGNAATATTLQNSRTINGTSFNGSANITTASWGTSRTITIGSTGKSVDGSGNVSWSLAEIGAQAAGSYAAASHTHAISDITGLQTALDGKQPAGSYAAASHNHTSLTGVTSIGFAAEGSDSASISTTVSGTSTFFDFNLTDDNNNDEWRWRFTPSGASVYNAMRLVPATNTTANLVVSGTISASNFSGSSSGTNTGDQTTISGNAGSATVLQTARTLTIGNTGKTFNGSANVSWSLAEIGAQAAGSYAAASHTHTPSEVGLGNVSNVAQVTTTNNSSLNSDSRNTRGVTRLYRRDDNSDYSVQTYWTGSYWRLYGYNGDSGHADTQVGYSDSSGYASSAGNADTVDGWHRDDIRAWGNLTGKPNEIFNYDGWVSSPGYDANTIGGNKSGFTYSNNAPYNGPLAHFAASGYGLQLNSTYSGTTRISFRSRNGDNGTWNGWGEFITSNNIGSQNVSYATSAGSASSASSASNADRLYPFGAAIDSTHPGYGLRAWYDWAYSGTYRNGISLGSNPGDQAYGWQLWQNMWDDRTYTRRYNGGWQSTRTLLTAQDDPYAYNMNQYVRTDSAPTFQEVYTNGWFRNNNSNQGLYNQSTTMHWSSRENGYWDASSTTSVSSIRFYTGGHVSSLRGYVYANTSNEIGFLNSVGSWSLRCDNSGNVTATGDLTAYSDARLKTNVNTIDKALDKVLQMRGVTYVRTDNNDTAEKIGVIAQEMQQVLPQVVQENSDGFLTVSYGNIVGVLIEAIKEQQKEIETLKSRLA